MILLLDAANTLIYKPKFYETFVDVVNANNNLNIKRSEFEYIHKLVSECYIFPDKTSHEFYNTFNSELLYALGIIPSNELLDSIFKACSYLPWQVFEDAKSLTELNCKKAILSNFHKGLNDIIDQFLPNQFASITISENEKYRKPDVRFFERAIEQLNTSPSEIIYVGDSIKLDIEPALKVGMKAFLIDRNNYYPHCKTKISSFNELKHLI